MHGNEVAVTSSFFRYSLKHEAFDFLCMPPQDTTYDLEEMIIMVLWPQCWENPTMQ